MERGGRSADRRSASTHSRSSSSSSRVGHLMAVAQEDIKVCNTCGRLCFYVNLARKHECHLRKPVNESGRRTKSVLRKKTSAQMSKETSTSNVSYEKSAARICQSQPQRPVEKTESSQPVTQRKSLADEVRVVCGYCERKFAPDRVVKHREICQRLAETETKPAKKPVVKAKVVKKQVTEEPEKKLDWRKKHAEFIAAIRSAQVMKAHLAAGGKLSDLPPPPPSDTSDYIACPHCDRKFNKTAAERHIPFCETQHRRDSIKKTGGETAKKKPKQRVVVSTKTIKKR